MTSTVSLPQTTIPASPGLALGRALLTVVGVLGALFVATWLSGAVAAENLPWVGYGVALALVGGALALLVHRRIFDRRATAHLGNDPRLLSMRLQGLLGLGFGIKVALVLVAVFVLRGNDVKFPQLAAFAVAFAAASLVAQLTLANALVRSASNSSRSSSS
ncbi:MAG: hypothetical protein H6838_07025 [Planctomycetes bacterium]|nr:hypothetical protein [Planctomycetota bacterium]MCB9885227.1 hypothetical protein [Planctomycetota bacterium]